MPQLDFTIWLFNLTINWSILLTVFLILNNYYAPHPNITNVNTNLSPNNNSTWNWN